MISSLDLCSWFLLQCLGLQSLQFLVVTQLSSHALSSCLAVWLHLVHYSCLCALSCICLCWIACCCCFRPCFQFVQITLHSKPSFLAVVVSSHQVSSTGLIKLSTTLSLYDVWWTIRLIQEELKKILSKGLKLCLVVLAAVLRILNQEPHWWSVRMYKYLQPGKEKRLGSNRRKRNNV